MGIAYKKLTENGKTFVKNNINSNSISGNKTMNADFSLYFTIYPPLRSTTNFLWKSNIVNNVTTFADNLIAWYDKYASEYELDANMLAAQGYSESHFKIWEFSKNKNGSPAAMGLTQFMPATIYGIIVSNGYGILPKFTNDEINKITKNITQSYLDSKFSPYNQDKLKNAPILLQNLIDNPELLVKAQARYMKYCANKGNSLASSALFGYNRGDGLIKSTYFATVQAGANYRDGYEKEGVDYVYKVFKLLYDSFGYKDLGMDKPTPNFDIHSANLA